MAASDAIKVPKKNVAWLWVFEIRDNTGALVAGAVFDSGLTSGSGKALISKDLATHVNSTNSITEIGSGQYYLLVSQSEMNNDSVAIVARTTTSNAKNETVYLYLAGTIDVNATAMGGTTLTARDIGTSVLLSNGTGAGQIIMASGQLTVGTNNDKTAYALTQPFPTNFSSFAIDSSGRVDVIKIAGTTQTARDLGTSILLSNGTGTGQVILASGHIANVDTLTTYTGNTVQTGDAYARLGAPVGASHSADVATVKSDTGAIKTKTDSLTFTVAGQVDANTLKIGGTTQTARDLGTSVLLANGTGTGQILLSSGNVSISQAFPTNFSALLINSSGHISRVTLTDTLTTYIGNTVQTGDSFARIGATGTGLTSLAAASTALSTAQWTNARAGYLDNINNSNLSTTVAQTGDSYARLGVPAGASHSADTAAVKSDSAAIKAKTDNLPASPAAVGSNMGLTDGVITDAKFTMPTEATGAPSTALQILLWIAGILGLRRVVRDSNAGTLTQYMANSTTVKSTSTYTSASGVDTINKAS